MVYVDAPSSRLVASAMTSDQEKAEGLAMEHAHACLPDDCIHLDAQISSILKALQEAREEGRAESKGDYWFERCRESERKHGETIEAVKGLVAQARREGRLEVLRLLEADMGLGYMEQIRDLLPSEPSSGGK